MTEQGLEAKISDLVALAGVLPRDVQHATNNFRELPETEIDRRLDRLRAGKQRLEAWRLEHGLEAAPEAEPVPADLGNVSATIGIPSDLYAERLAEFARLIGRVRAWRPPVPDVLADQIQRRIREFTEWNAQWAGAFDRHTIVAKYDAAEDPKRVMTTALRWITRDIETLISHPLLSAAHLQLTAMETIRALARLEIEVTARQPELLVALNEEGLAIAEVVRADLGLQTPLAVVRGAAPGNLKLHMMGGREPYSVGRVCVVGHLARTGATMLRTMDYAREWFGAAQVYGTVLAASVDAADRCDQAGKPLYYHYLSAAEKLSVAYDASHGVEITQDSFVLGGSVSESAPNDVLQIGRAALGLQRAELEVELSK
jgi:hypothetical protein